MSNTVEKSAFLLIAAASSVLGLPASAADMIRHETRSVQAREVRPVYVRAADAGARHGDCQDLVVTYSTPYQPHRDIIRACTVSN